jgi:alpha-beta hydrolase superfamily lysophospholipase
VRKWTGDVVFLLLIGALVAGWLYLYPKPGESILTPLATPSDLNVRDLPSYVSPDGTKLSYRLYEPPGQATHVLVLLHDTLLHGGWYSALGRDLAARGIAVYLPDRRGWGHSPGDRRAVEADTSVLVEDITAVIAAAQSRYPQAPVYLGGHGRAAGLVTRYLASKRPVAGVVLLSPHLSDAQPNLNPDGWQELVSAHPVEAFLARQGLTYWRVWRYNWPASMTDADPLIEARTSISWQEEVAPEDIDAAYAALTVPLLTIQGERDPLFSANKAEELMARFPSSDQQLAIVPDTDYLTVIEGAADTIAGWLADR